LSSASNFLSEFVRPPSAEAASLAARMRALEEQIARQNADNEALTRSCERARVGESAAVGRTNALATELGAARTKLELEQKKARDVENTLAERIAAAGATHSRSEEALREVGRYQTELRALRDSLAAREQTLGQSTESLREREAQLAALQREHTKMVSALEAHTKAGMQTEADLQSAQMRATALAADLAAARSALESEQSNTRDLNSALTRRITSTETANSRNEEALRELERGQTDLRTLRDLLAARDAALVQGRRSIAERETQLTTLQQEHVKTLSALEARAKTGTRLEADLQIAQARADAISLDLKTVQAAGAELSAQLGRSENHLKAALSELAAVKVKESSHLELLRTREWRGGFDHNLYRELDTRVDAAGVGHRALLTEREQLQARVADLQKKLDAHVALVDELRTAANFDAKRVTDLQAAAPRREPEQVATVAPHAETREQKAVPLTEDSLARGVAWKRRAMTRATGVGAAVIVLAAIAWSFVHQRPVPPPVPVVSSIALPTAGTVIRDCPTCPAMTVLPAGRFRQGSDRPDSGSESFEKPSHWVAIGRPLAMATTTVTVDEFQEFIAATGQDMQGCDTYDGEWKHRAKNSWKNPGFVQTGAHPVTCVSWNDAKAYASWLSAKTGHGYRLPSASEWEYAARSGGEAVQPWNPDGSDACANANVADASAAHKYPGWTVFGCDDGYVYTAPVGSFKATSMGLSDMLGNVFQWTEDCWSPDYIGAPTDGSARADGNCSEHELRGGSWFSTPTYVKASYRNHFAADYRTSSVGIRLVRDIER
jgi:formylglycine-generating enzyme required for sulfatase activity